jgi:CRISPR-associated protein Cmr6
MNQPNYGWKFYRDYFNDVNFRITDKKKQEDIFKPKNNAFERARLIPLSSNSNSPQGFSLKLLYPGLLSGIGYTMGVGMAGEFKIGFYFDHTTGMPVIPGSSIKGVLRSVFPAWQGEGLNSKLKRSSKNDEQKARFLWNLISNIQDIDATKFSKKDDKTILTENEKKIIRQIELEIFEGRNIKKELEKPLEALEEFLGIYNTDLFFDAFVESAVNDDDEPTKDRIFGTDSITPHGDNPLRNPNPLLFLKVLPGTTWRFCFDLKNGLHLKAVQKEELFKQIILTIGIGAKTNVGYGQFDEDVNDHTSLDETSDEINSLPDEKTPDLPKKPEFKYNSLSEEKVSLKAIPFLKKGKKFQAEMVGQTDKYNLYRFNAGYEECVLKKVTTQNPDVKIGDSVTIRFVLDYTKENPNFKIT